MNISKTLQIRMEIRVFWWNLFGLSFDIILSFFSIYEQKYIIRSHCSENVQDLVSPRHENCIIPRGHSYGGREKHDAWSSKGEENPEDMCLQRNSMPIKTLTIQWNTKLTLYIGGCPAMCSASSRLLKGSTKTPDRCGEFRHETV